MGSKYAPNDHDLLSEIRDLRRRIEKLERTPQTSNAGIDQGAITVINGEITVNGASDDPTGSHIHRSNEQINGEPGSSYSVRRSDTVNSDYFDSDGNNVVGMGSIDITSTEGVLVDPFFRVPTVEIKDKSGDTILADSNNARRGFSHPYLPIPWGDKVLSTTTSGTLADIAQLNWYQYHPHLRVEIVYQNDGGTAGTVVVQEELTGNIVGSVSTPAGGPAYSEILVKRSALIAGTSPNGNPTILNIQHARASGAGTVRTRVVNIIGIDLSWFEDF